MRRSDRQITDANEIKLILDKCIVCRLGMSKDNMPYVVPMNFGYKEENGKFAFYFHCAMEGEKLETLKQNNNVCVEMDCSHEFIQKETDCSSGMAYESVIAKGTVKIADSMQEKMEALRLVVKQCKRGSDECNVKEEETKKVTCFIMEVSEINAKRAIKKI